MARIPQPFIFSWDQIDATSDLDRLRLVLSALPDEPLMLILEAHRGRGRDDYPIRAVWNAVIAGIVFQLASVAALLRELRRNAELRQRCGFDPLLGARAVPTDEAMSRFLLLLCEHQAEVEAMFDSLVRELGYALPDLGRTLAVDSKAIQSFGRPVKDAEKLASPDGRRELTADWGTKTYEGVREDGSAWEKVVRWFGFKLHLLVDSEHELPLAFHVTQASANDSPWLLPLLEAHEEHHLEVASRSEELAADKAYDSADNKAVLWDEHGIKPLIPTRRLWKEEPDKPRSLFPDRADVFLYDESGRVYCQAPTERRGQDELRLMTFDGFEPGRGTLKYRCPAAACGLTCQGRAECECLSRGGVGPYGRVVRVPLDHDRRIFTPIAQGTQKWEKAYDRRTSVERVNSRLDRVLGFELHTIRGLAKMQLRVGLALVVMLAMALGRIRVNQRELMRSLTAPVRAAA